MSTLTAVKPYDQVFDGQRLYRTLLQATARPGTIGLLDDVAIEVPRQLNRATALIALALFSGDITYHLDQGETAACNFFQRETAAKAADPEQADFVILADARRLEPLRQARTGSLLFPDLGASVIAQVRAISPAPIQGGLRLRLTGPGIETEAEVYLLGVAGDFFETLREQNAEFPLGVDVYFTCDSLSAGPCAMALPRTTHVRWEQT